MSDLDTKIGLIIRKSSEIEGLLKRMGAKGSGLNDLRACVKTRLDAKTFKALGIVIHERNMVAHEAPSVITDEQLRKFNAAAESSIAVLTRASTSAGATHSLVQKEYGPNVIHSASQLPDTAGRLAEFEASPARAVGSAEEPVAGGSGVRVIRTLADLEEYRAQQPKIAPSSPPKQPSKIKQTLKDGGILLAVAAAAALLES